MPFGEEASPILGTKFLLGHERATGCDALSGILEFCA
jgi:hypothetical protein